MMRSLLKNRKQMFCISSTSSDSDRNRQKIKAVDCFTLDDLFIQLHWPGF